MHKYTNVATDTQVLKQIHIQVHAELGRLDADMLMIT